MCGAKTGGARADLLHNLDKIMLILADSGQCRSRWHNGSRAIMALGAVGDKPARVCGRLGGHSLLTLFYLCAKRGAERPQVSDQSAVARREDSCSGAARSGVRRGAAVPRRSGPMRVSAASVERTGFDRFNLFVNAVRSLSYRPCRVGIVLFDRVVHLGGQEIDDTAAVLDYCYSL